MKHPDLHLHTTWSDGTDSPAEILAKVKAAGIDFFSVTDHDTIGGAGEILALLQEQAQKGEAVPLFVPGAEFSCRDEDGRYHVLGYAYSLASPAIHRMVETFHTLRMQKLEHRLAYLREAHGIVFSEAQLKKLKSFKNPGKPHIGRLIAESGYAADAREAIRTYLLNYKGPGRKIRPEEAIAAITESGGIPVLAHGIYGNGSQHLTEAAFDRRVERLRDMGLMGLECFYSRYTKEEEALLLRMREKYGLLATAGSDYHGRNKTVAIGCTGAGGGARPVPCLREFAKECQKRGYRNA